MYFSVVSFTIDFKLDFIILWQMHRFFFNCSVFVEIFFVFWYVTYFRESFLGYWRECILCVCTLGRTFSSYWVGPILSVVLLSSRPSLFTILSGWQFCGLKWVIEVTYYSVLWLTYNLSPIVFALWELVYFNLLHMYLE